eukprot:gene7913-biopygen21098
MVGWQQGDDEPHLAKGRHGPNTTQNTVQRMCCVVLCCAVLCCAVRWGSQRECSAATRSAESPCPALIPRPPAPRPNPAGGTKSSQSRVPHGNVSRNGRILMGETAAGASHTIEFEETDASRPRPRPFLPTAAAAAGGSWTESTEAGEYKKKTVANDHMFYVRHPSDHVQSTGNHGHDDISRQGLHWQFRIR